LVSELALIAFVFDRSSSSPFFENIRLDFSLKQPSIRTDPGICSPELNLFVTLAFEDNALTNSKAFVGVKVIRPSLCNLQGRYMRPA